MASLVVTLRIMPESPQTDLSKLEEKAKEAIKQLVGKTEFKASIQPVAFGLKALNIVFLMDESFSDTEKIEKEVSKIPEVSSGEIIDLRRAVG